MLEFSKKILENVSFDKKLFQKELRKNIVWLNKRETLLLKIWALSAFSEYKNIILKVFDQLS